MSIKRIANPLTKEVRWEVRVYENGRGSKRISKRFEKRSDAEVWLLEFDKKQDEKSKNPFSTISFENRFFASEAEYWLLDGKNRFSPGHYVKSKAVITSFLKTYSNIAVDRLTPEFLSNFQQLELKTGSSAATVNRKTEIITAVLNHSVKHRRIPFNPATGFRKLTKVQNEMEFWSKEEAESFLTCMSEKYPASSKTRWVYVAYLLALNTGLRAGEIWGLKPQDLSEEQNAIFVKRQFNRVSLDFGPTKGKKHRVVPANQELMRELKAIIANDRVALTETIFRNHERKPICHDNFATRNFVPDLKIWNGKQIRFHDMRHTAITLLIANGVDLKTVKEICGHSDITTTMNYVHLVNGSIEKVALTFSISAKNREVKPELKVV